MPVVVDPDDMSKAPTAPFPPDLSQRLRSLIARVGEKKACELLDTPRATLARAAGSLPLRRATAEVLAMRLEVVERAA